MRPRSTLLIAMCVATTAALVPGVIAAAAASTSSSPARPVLTSIAPGGGPVAGGTRVTIHGHWTSRVTEVTFGRQRGTHLDVLTPHKLRVSAPEAAGGLATVRIHTVRSRSQATAATRYRYAQTPAIDRVEPQQGATNGKSSPISIDGQNLDHPLGVFFGRHRATHVDVVTPSYLRVTPPAHAAGYVQIRIRTYGGTSATSPATRLLYTVPSKVHWTATPTFDVFRGHIVALACPMNHCTAIDEHSVVQDIDGSPLSPQMIDSDAWLRDLSCPTIHFCMAVDSSGRALTSSDGEWSIPRQVAGSLQHVTCAAATMCLAYDTDNRWYRYNGTRWTHVHDHPAQITDMSCAARNFCLAVGAGNTANIYDGSAWTATTFPGKASASAVVDCVSSEFCMVGTGRGLGIAYRNGVWDQPQQAFVDDWPDHVACATPSFCVAASTTDLAVYDGSSWHNSLHARGTAYGVWTDVSCAESQCSAANALGEIDTSTADGWGGPIPVIPTGAPLDAIDCPSVTFCAAVDGEGNALTFDGNGWSEPTLVDSAHLSAGHSVSCPTVRFCMAVSQNQYSTLHDNAWSPPNSAFPGADSTTSLVSVSCASSSLCVAVGGPTGTYRWDGTSWSRLATPSELDAISVSCASPTYCVAVGRTDYAIFDGTTWEVPSPAIDTPAGDWVESVSCPTTSFCMAGAMHGQVVTFDGKDWSRPRVVGPGYDMSNVDCASLSYCVAVDWHGNVTEFDHGNWTTSSLLPQTVDRAGTILSCAAPRRCWVTGGTDLYSAAPAR